jgi:uncharacterized protein
MFENGQGVAQDYAEAVRLYRLAAAQGHADAQFNLGDMFENGQGVAQDLAIPLNIAAPPHAPSFHVSFGF